ncbi:MAG: EamA family transporter [Actinobacteria bacterium]|nr:EamA family transporter [Actinomycetota bacterium]
MFSAVLALFGALVYGSADFLGGLAAKRLRSMVVTAVAAISGLVLLALAYPLVGGAWSAADVAWGALSGITGVAAIALLYASLAIGPMSILSPLTAVVSAVGPMLWGLLVGGESLAPVGYAGLGLALVAVVLVGFIPGASVVRPSGRGILMAIGSGLAIGAFLIIVDQTSPESGIVPLLVNRAVNGAITATIVIVMILISVRRGNGARRAIAAQGAHLGATPSGRADLEHATRALAHATETSASTTPPVRDIPRAAWWAAIGCGVVDATANAIMLIALRAGDLSIVSALTALYPAGTILLAALVLRERIAAVQWAGLALALTAGGMLAVS